MPSPLPATALAALLSFLALAALLGAAEPAVSSLHAAPRKGKAPAQLVSLVRRGRRWAIEEEPAPFAAATATPGTCPRCDNRKRLKAVDPKAWNKYPFASVVLVEVELSYLYKAKCTGVLIRPNRVLTAGHCVSDAEPGIGPLVFTDGTVRFGAFGSKTYGPTAQIVDAYYYPDWELKGLSKADVAVLYLDRNIKGVPVAKYATGSSLAKGNAVRAITTVGYPHFRGDAGSSNNYRFASSTTKGYQLASLNRPCETTDANGLYSFNLPNASGMSGGPVFDDASKKIVAISSIYCTPGACDFDYACTSGYAPISTAYSIDKLASR